MASSMFHEHSGPAHVSGCVSVRHRPSTRPPPPSRTSAPLQTTSCDALSTLCTAVPLDIWHTQQLCMSVAMHNSWEYGWDA